MKNNFDTHVCHVPIASSSINKHVACSTLSSSIKDDICVLKKSKDYLGSTLSQCASNYKRLESTFHKKHAPNLHAHPSWHTHAHHTYTYDFMYARVYTCTHCGRIGHLVKFCYDKINIINFASKNIWVRRGANPGGLEKV